jgi:hypothetical protein
MDASAALKKLAIQELAYRFWQQRGSPHDLPEEDWFRAENELRVEHRSEALPLYAFGIERVTR